MTNLAQLKKRCIQKKGAKLFTQFTQTLQNATQTCAEPDIHQMRVMVKKWRALLALAAYCQPKKEINAFMGHYKQLFTLAGKIRNAQVHTLFLEEQQLAPDMHTYLIQLQQDEQKYSLKLKKAYAKYQKTTSEKKLQKKYNAFLTHINASGIKTYQTKTANLISEVITNCYANELELHNLRKLLKQWQYNLNLLQQCGFSFRYSTELTEFLTPFNELLGKWQDAAVAIDYLNELNEKQILIMDEYTFQKLCDRIARTQTACLNQIMYGLIDLSALLVKIE